MSTYFLILVTMFFISCNGIKREIVEQMKVQEANNEIQIDVFNQWKPVGQTMVLISTSETSTLNCLFTSEVIGAIDVAGITHNQILPYIRPLEIRILVDDEVSSPGATSFVPAAVWAYPDYFSSQSIMVTCRNIPAGSHTVRVEWRQPIDKPARKNPRMRNRTLAVWQTIDH